MAKVPTVTESATRSLNKEGFIPLYYQIQQQLMEKINRGELAAGDPLASEEELSRQYQVSRMTARQALNGLKVKGYAFSEKGRGTFVSAPKHEKNILHLQGFSAEMQKLGLKPSSRVLEQSVIEAPEGVAERLRLRSSRRVLFLHRLRLADGVPLAVETSHIPLEHFPGIERINFARHSLYRTLGESYGVRLGWAEETIEALAATREEAKLLTVPERSSILSITRTIMTTEETPVEAACSRYRGDRYRASIRVPATAIR